MIMDYSVTVKWQIRMKHQSRCRVLPFYSHAECRQGQRRIDAVGKRIPHYFLGAALDKAILARLECM